MLYHIASSVFPYVSLKFHAIVPFLYPLKIPVNLWCSGDKEIKHSLGMGYKIEEIEQLNHWS